MKNKLVMIVLGVILVLAAGAMVYAIYSTQSGKEVFAEDGYIIVYDETDTEQPAKTYHLRKARLLNVLMREVSSSVIPKATPSRLMPTLSFTTTAALRHHCLRAFLSTSTRLVLLQ